MDFKGFFTIMMCLFGTCGPETQTGGKDASLANLQTQAGAEYADIEPRKTIYGDFLISQFAQQHHDWQSAGSYLDDVLKRSPGDSQIQKRAMVLAMGAGDFQKALEIARKVDASEKNNSLALLFLAAGALHEKNYEQANTYIKGMPPGSLSEFIMPLLQSWAQAGVGVYSPEDLNKNIIQINHAIMIADFLGKKDEIENVLNKAILAQDISPVDLENIADTYAHIGRKDKAIELYKRTQKEWPENTGLASKIETLQQGGNVQSFKNVSSPEQGMALALSNMAQLLYQEYADESARVFANVAVYLDPQMIEAKLLLAAISSRNGRQDDAIALYRDLPKDSEYFLEARRRVADLLEDTKRTDEAVSELKNLFRDHNDIESLIRIGDIYRRQENFNLALSTYNEAAGHFGNKVPKEYWHLLYARGMSHEQTGDWNAAESDLKAALSYQPDHPYILNYLGYAWTDKGVHLDEALAMLKKAAALRPSDGYIADSLGWVYYRMGRYEEALPYLESAIEMAPYDATINDHLGDAYWRVGRKLEARFQWQRAKSNSEDQSLILAIDQKILEGLQNTDTVKQAHTEISPDGDGAINR